MEAAPSVKQRRGSPPIPPNYVSLRQLQELRLKEKEEKEEEEKRQRQREEAARKAEIEAKAAAAIKRDAARKPLQATEQRDRGPGPQWVAVAHHPAVPLPPPRGEVVLGTMDAPRGGGRPEGKAKGNGKGKVSAIPSAQTRTDEPGRPVSGDASADPGSIGGSGESAGASSRGRNNPKGKKGAGGRRRAEPSPAGASPPQGIKPENAGKPKSPGAKRADASPVSDPSHGKKTEAWPAPPTSDGAGSVGELRTTAEEKPEGLVEEHRRPPPLEDQGVAKQKPRVFTSRAWPRPPSDRCHRAGEQHVRVWVPKAAAGSAEL